MTFFKVSAKHVLFHSFTFLLVLLLQVQISVSYSTLETSKTSKVRPFIIHTDNVLPSVFTTRADWHSTLLESLESPKINFQDRLIYSYEEVINGFSAKLTTEEASKLSLVPGIVSVDEDSDEFQLHTTRSSGFLGLDSSYGIWPETRYGEDVVIGFIDTGIWPESRSFNDDGLGPIPQHWKGECEEGEEFNSSCCNNKLIGARIFPRGIGAIHGPLDVALSKHDYSSPRDSDGHGTHVASIAAGMEVPYASLFGFANGTARGVATKARVAMYKVSWLIGNDSKSTSSDILAAIDRAIQDGVHCLSLSIGSPYTSYHENVIAVGAFAAMRKGIFVSAAAGNFGSNPFSVTNTAPWMTTVAAGTIDRTFMGKFTLGNGEVLQGTSLYGLKISNHLSFPLIYLQSCDSDSFVTAKVKGKIVLCDFNYDIVDVGLQLKAMGGVGLIQLITSMVDDIPFRALNLPGLSLEHRESERILSYLKTTSNPIGSFSVEDPTVVGRERAPRVASFSSMGPNPVVPEILKPDIMAPGDLILAAWVPNKPVTPDDPRRVAFNILSGTSMSCPHVAAVAALLQSAHPTWSPAGIRSAMLTTSRILDNYDRPIVRINISKPETPLSFGAGHINPQRALDPGLIYDVEVDDYVNFLCCLNYTNDQLLKIVKGPVSCPDIKGQPGNLNYPSILTIFSHDKRIQVLNRTLTNVAEATLETYTVKVINSKPEKVAILVQPKKLTFEKIYQKYSYEVKFESRFNGTIDIGHASPVEEIEFAYIVWESEKHFVRIPVVFMWRSV